MSAKQRDFAKHVLDAFAAAGNHTDREVSDAGGPSSTFMTLLRKVAAGKSTFPALRSDTLRRIDAAANWRYNASRDFWMSGEVPTEDSLGRPLSEGNPPPNRIGDPQEAYVRKLDARILETEERLDLLERQVNMLGRYMSDVDENMRDVALDAARGVDETAGGSEDRG